MSDASRPAPNHPAPDHLVFTYTSDDLAELGRLTARRVDRGPSWDSYWTAEVAGVFGIGFTALGAAYAGLVPAAAFKAVLATAYAAFLAGAVAHRIAMHVRTRSLQRASYKAAQRDTEQWRLSFNETGLRYSCDVADTRLSWRAVRAVEDTGTLVLIWFYDLQALGIPPRAFADAAARAAFVAAIAARIEAADTRPPGAMDT